MAQLLPDGATGIGAHQATRCYDTQAWRRDHNRLWSELRPVLRQTIKELSLPSGFYERVADAVVTSTQWVAGFTEYLRRAEIAVVVTDFDRHDMWAPLVLSAASLGVPSYTLMLGVFGEECAGFYPLLADKIFCWGRMFQDKLVAAGVNPSRIIVSGCPRLTRDLSKLADEARENLGLDADRPVVVLGTQDFASIRHRLQLAESFCRSVDGLGSHAGVIRLHPLDELALYSDLIRRFPSIKFMASEDYALDDVIAAADVVVVHSSGLGSDALVKRRLAVVLDVIDLPLGHGQDLIDHAGCPRATSAESLGKILKDMLHNGSLRRQYERCREEYVEQFCACYGDESAKHIADHVLRAECGAEYHALARGAHVSQRP